MNDTVVTPASPDVIITPPPVTLGGMKSEITAVWGLFLAGLIIPFAGIVGVILAYVKRGDADNDAQRSHFARAITLFWYSLIGSIIGIVLAFFIVGYFVLIGVLIWYLVVAVKGLTRSLDDRAYDS